MDSNQPKVDTSTVGNETNPAQTVAESKGKGKAANIAPQDVSMGEEDSSSDEETGAEDEAKEEPEEEDDDNMEEIDPDNIINDGRRTRGKSIDFAKAAENAGDELDDDDDDDDDDFEEKEDDAMQD